MIKISILVPAFKPNFLKECIDSILAQTYQNFELIIVNDASPHDLDSVINIYNDKRIHYYTNQKGCGGLRVVDNWNICLKYSQGDFVICMGDDDKLLPNCLEDYLHLIEKYPKLDVYHSFTEMIDENSQLMDMQQTCPEYESIYSLIWNFWKGRDQYIGDYLFRTSSLKEKGGFVFTPYAWSADKLSIYEAAKRNGIANTQRPGFQYRKNSHNITSTSSTQRERYKALLIEKKWYEEFLKEVLEPSTEIDKKYLMLLRRNLKVLMMKRLDSMMFWDVTDNPSHFSYWKRKQKEYGIDNQSIKHARYISYKEKLKSILKK